MRTMCVPYKYFVRLLPCFSCCCCALATAFPGTKYYYYTVVRIAVTNYVATSLPVFFFHRFCSITFWYKGAYHTCNNGIYESL